MNVRLPAPPDWLAAVINDATPQLGAYPRTEEAVAAIAAAHEVSPESVLPTAGGAEAFTLLARALHPQRAVVVHPQFTEPEAALRAAGHRPERVLLAPATGFSLDPSQVPADADLVMVGNPTNPTGILHPAATLRRLLRPGRILVVDEAFMDAVPGEPETMITATMPGLVVLRSLTKTWGLAGLRAGYAVGDPDVISGHENPAAAMVGLDPGPGRDRRLPDRQGPRDRRRRGRGGLRAAGRTCWSDWPSTACGPSRNRVRRSCCWTPAGPTARPAGSARPCAPRGSLSAAARRSPGWARTGSASRSAIARPPTASRPPWTGYSDETSKGNDPLGPPPRSQ